MELPENIKNSPFLNVQQLALLMSVTKPDIDPAFEDNRVKNIFQYYSLTPDEMETELQQYAAELLTEGKVNEAWQVLLTTNSI